MKNKKSNDIFTITLRRKHVKLMLSLMLLLISLYILVSVAWGTVGFLIFGTEIMTHEPYSGMARMITNFIGDENTLLNMAFFSLVIIPPAIVCFLASYAVAMYIPALRRIRFIWFSLALLMFLVGFTIYETLFRMDSPANTYWYDFSVRSAVGLLRLIVAWIIARYIQKSLKYLKNTRSCLNIKECTTNK